MEKDDTQPIEASNRAIRPGPSIWICVPRRSRRRLDSVYSAIWAPATREMMTLLDRRRRRWRRRYTYIYSVLNMHA